MSIYVGSTDVKNIYIGQNITDMQGPCPTGFHVPSKDENVALVAAMTALGIDTSNGNCMKTYLKMPFAGYRHSSSAGVNSQGTSAYYWSSIAYSADRAYNLRFGSAGLRPQSGGSRSYGFSVRCFKNSSLQPTSSWTTLFDGSGIAAGAGIFHNTTDGVISISSDGTNWITIADKNLGATTVYNDGDTLSQANCGNYYQWGNNYGFPRTGSVTTSSTQVDASNYGPGNYYNSSTFITRSSSPYDWSSVQNDNLRGGQYTPVKSVYVGTTKVRPALKTFTVTFTETSSPSSFNPVYSDDAAGLTAGSTAFDEFFGYSAVRLNTSGVETAEITQAQSGGAGKLDITQLGTLTSGDNVMIKFPVRGIKMTKNGRTITLSITKETGRESEGYQYYAFQKTGDIEANASATVATSPLYLGTYLSYTDGSTLKSWSGKTPQGNYTMGNAITYAGNNGTGYTITGFYQRELINAYYMMKYGNPDCQSVIGRGFVDGNSAATATGGTNSQTNATYGESTGKYSVKLFGLEDWRGNQHQRVGGMFTNASKNMWTALHDFTASISTSESQYKNAGAISHSGSYYDISSILGSNKGMFAPTATVNSSNYDTYWCDYGLVNASRLAVAGGDWSNGSSAGAFLLGVVRSASDAGTYVGARLMFL